MIVKMAVPLVQSVLLCLQQANALGWNWAAAAIAWVVPPAKGSLRQLLCPKNS